MPATLQQQVREIHRDVEHIKESMEMLVDRYIEEQHTKLRQKSAFISLAAYKKKRAVRR